MTKQKLAELNDDGLAWLKMTGRERRRLIRSLEKRFRKLGPSLNPKACARIHLSNATGIASIAKDYVQEIETGYEPVGRVGGAVGEIIEDYLDLVVTDLLGPNGRQELRDFWRVDG